MIIVVSVVFIVCWFPNNMFFMIGLSVAQHTTGMVVGYYPTVFLAYLNVCMNPFIYATKHEGVKRELARLMVCPKPRAVGDEIASSSNRAAAGGGTTQELQPRGRRY